MQRHPIDTLLKHIFLVLGLVTAAIFFVITIWGDNGLKELWQLKQKKETLAKSNLELLHQNWLYYEEIKRLSDPKNLEQAARTELGMVRENETVYVIEQGSKP